MTYFRYCFLTFSQRSIASVMSTSSQQGDSEIECNHETSPDSTSPPSFAASSKKHFAFEQGSALPQDGVMVPFLVLLVKDVYFLNHAIPTIDEAGNVNVEKLRNLANILSPLEEWNTMTSSYHKHDEMQDFLLRSSVQDDADLYLLSYKREAPTNRFEKQQLKSLRVERDLKKKNDSGTSRRRKTV
ncbi:ras-GEF domain-containing family member 1B-like isoform X1 [Clavelina lepadiformis]|uniref:ras-GEF domain-containing family member 1B-like isoform X1 n=2 Tax=Clavelina lepadiformis TaxID=159417 RepID=UPI0040428B2D